MAKASPDGIGIAARVTGCGEALRVRRKAHDPAAARRAPATAPAASQAVRSRRLLETTTGAATPAWDPACATQASSALRSWALCQRSSGSLARQFFTIRSSAGGVIGAIEEREGGSEDMIEEISEAWLAPAKAFFPVAIS